MKVLDQDKLTAHCLAPSHLTHNGSDTYKCLHHFSNTVVINRSKEDTLLFKQKLEKTLVMLANKTF